jgi:CDP-diacylglycerol--glycerol-3-phosphate 3-phosphatidyltransferase
VLRIPLKSAVTDLITPMAKAALKLGITANAVTIAGAIGSWAASLYFFTTGKFFVGTLVITVLVLSDLFDGTMARLSGDQPSKFGALLDSTLDRVTDAILLISLLLWALSDLAQLKNSSATLDRLILLILIALLTGFLISYIKAKAESLDINCEVGIAERSERLIVLLVATGLYGLGVGLALEIGLWILVLINLITVFQRSFHVVKAS